MKFPFEVPSGREFDCAGFGENSVDHLIVVPAYPNADDKLRYSEYKRTPGGQVASAMVGLERLGLRTAYVGRFGADEAGAFGLETLREAGVNVERAEVVTGARNQTAFIIIDARNGERTIIWDRDERLAYGEDETPRDFAARARVLHLDAHDPASRARLAREARAAGTIVSLDVDDVYEGVSALLPQVDVLISSKEFPRRLTGLSDEREALRGTSALMGERSIVGMTLGQRGAVIYHKGRFLEAPALPVPGGCRDTTGAGDAFRTGFLYGLLRGEEMEDCLKMGCAVAALKCRGLGARTTLPTRAELEQFLAATPTQEASKR
jgi:sugar/nucleoside kinase (ribokinase family)